MLRHSELKSIIKREKAGKDKSAILDVTAIVAFNEIVPFRNDNTVWLLMNPKPQALL